MTAPTPQTQAGHPAQSPPNNQAVNPQGQPGQPSTQGDQNGPQPAQFPQQQTGTSPWSGLLDVASQQSPQQPGQIPAPQFPAGYPQQGSPGGVDQQALADLIGRAVSSAVDRRVNQMNNPQWQQAHQPPQQGGAPQPPAPQQYQQQYQPPPVATGPSEADQREARMAAREYLGDRITFGSEAERAMAVDLTSALIPTQLLMGATPNQAGLAVAQAVADRVTSLRQTYSDQAVRALRARGLLNEPPQSPAVVAGSVGFPQGGTPVGTGSAQQTAAKAKQLQSWAAEENAQRGWNTAPATATSG